MIGRVAEQVLDDHHAAEIVADRIFLGHADPAVQLDCILRHEAAGLAYADTEADYDKAVAEIPVPFERVEKALGKQGSGPFFNGAKYSLVDAAYAPFLQRYYFLDRVKKLVLIEKYPRLKAWMEALLARPSTHSFPPAEFEAMYRDGLKRRNKFVSRFIEPTRAAAE